MNDEHKIFKSKTIELFGYDFEVSHKANNVINNRFLILLAFIKYYIKKLYNVIFCPIIKCINYLKEHGFFEPIICVLFMHLIFSVFIIVTPNTFSEINYRVDNCFARDCELFDKYCEEYKNIEWSIAKIYIRQHNYFLKIAYEQFILTRYWTMILLTIRFVTMCIVTIILGVFMLILRGLKYLYKKNYKKVQFLND